MRTYTLQCVSTLLLLATAFLSLAVAAQPRMAEPFHRTGWKVLGGMFVVFGADLALANVFQALALAGGVGSAPMNAYLGWAPVFDHSRTFLGLGGLAALALLAVWKGQPDRRFWRIAWALMIAGLLLGAGIGLAEGPFSIGRHLFAVVVWDVVELLTLMSVLFLLLLTNRADRALWTLLAAYACSLALGIFWLSLLSNFGVTWSPPVWTTHAVRNVFYAAMAGAAAARLTAARRGRPVHGMLGRPAAHLSTLH